MECMIMILSLYTKVAYDKKKIEKMIINTTKFYNKLMSDLVKGPLTLIFYGIKLFWHWLNKFFCEK